jgi:hypothetical protein
MAGAALGFSRMKLRPDAISNNARRQNLLKIIIFLSIVKTSLTLLLFLKGWNICSNNSNFRNVTGYENH